MISLSPRQKIILALKYPKATRNFFWDRLFYRRKAVPFPRLVNCFVTERCNFNCPMCHVKESRQRKMAELSFRALKKVFDEAGKFSPSFQLAGGEPLLHSELIKIIRYLTERKIVKGVVTNGLLLEEKAEELVSSGLDFLGISLDGPDEATQYRRGYVKGSFAKIVRGIKKVIKVRGERLFPNIRIATVISPINLDNYDWILKLAERLRVDQWSLSHYFYYFREIKNLQEKFAEKYQMGKDVWGDYLGEKKELFNQPEREQIKQKWAKISRLITEGKNKTRITFQEKVDIDQYYTGVFPSKKSVCTSPYQQIFIRGNGDVEICQGYLLGNIKKESILDIWHNQRSKHFRQVFEKVGVMPACFRCCALDIKFE